MTQTQTCSSQPHAGAAQIYGVVIGVGVACALLIVTVYEVTRPVILRNRIAQQGAAVLTVLPGAASSTAYQWDTQSNSFIESIDSAGIPSVFAGFDMQGGLVGVAIAAEQMGYQDRIRLLFGYSPKSQTVVGMKVLESRETPGLGDKIEWDTDFLANFTALDVHIDKSTGQIANRIEFVREGEAKHPWQIDGITGATISSRAVADMLDRTTVIWIPRVRDQVFHMETSKKERP